MNRTLSTLLAATAFAAICACAQRESAASASPVITAATTQATPIVARVGTGPQDMPMDSISSASATAGAASAAP